jgi:hypothetical protein
MRRVIWRFCEAFGASCDLVASGLSLLRARGVPVQLTGFEEYYGSTARQDDLARMGMTRRLAKRENESWEDFEARLAAFMGAEDWEGQPNRQRFTLSGDVAEWGCQSGLVRELERTGLSVVDIFSARNDPMAWRVLDFEDPLGGTEDDSMLLDIGEDPPTEDQRLTRVYDIGADTWTLWVTLGNPDEVDYLEDEVRAIVVAVKPPWVRANVLFPGAEAWEAIDG